MKSRQVIFTLFIVAFSMLVSCQTPGNELLTPTEFQQSLSAQKSGNVLLLDVRTPSEFAEGHLEGAVNLNYNSADFGTQCEALDKNAQVYVYCRSGGRSAKAVSQLHGMGFKHLHELRGGITSWEDAQMQVVR